MFDYLGVEFVIIQHRKVVFQFFLHYIPASLVLNTQGVHLVPYGSPGLLESDVSAFSSSCSAERLSSHCFDVLLTFYFNVKHFIDKSRTKGHSDDFF